MHLSRALIILFAFLLGGSPLLAAGTLSVTSSTHSVSAQATYLFRYIPEVNIPPQSTLQLTVGEAMDWPDPILQTDVQLTVNTSAVTLGSSETATVYGFAYTSPNIITITTPSSVTISADVQMELLVGTDRVFSNPNTAGTTTYQMFVRDSASQNLDVVDGLLLTQNLGVSLGAGAQEQENEDASTSTSSGTAANESTDTSTTEEEATEPTQEETSDTDPSEEVIEETPEVTEEGSEETTEVPMSTYDATKDGVVDFVDVSLLLESFEKFPTPEFDYDGDGDIDTRDLSNMLSNWTSSAEAPAMNPAPISSISWSTTPDSATTSTQRIVSKEVKAQLQEQLAPEDVRLFALTSDAPASVFAARARQVGERERYFVMLDTNEDGVNAVDMEIHYNPQELQFVESVTDQSIMNIWKYTPAVEEEGVLRLAAGSTESFAGIGGFLCELVFERVSNGDGELQYENVQMYHQHGKKAQVETRTELQSVETYIASIETMLEEMENEANEATQEPVTEQTQQQEIVESIEETQKEETTEKEEVLLMPPTLSSSTHPVQGKWYNQPEVQITVTDSRNSEYAVSQTRIPAQELVWESVNASTIEQTFEEGQWFIHVRNVQDQVTSAVTTFEVLVDTTPPSSFDVEVQTRQDVHGEKIFLVFQTTDERSGLAGYEVQQGARTTVVEQSPFWIGQVHAGFYQYDVHAIDRAGNRQTQRVSYTKVAPTRLLTSEQTAVLALLMTTFLLLIIRFVRSRAKNKV